MATGLRISIKWKIFALILFLITSTLIVVLSRTSQIFREDKEAFVKELGVKLAGVTAQDISQLVELLQDKLLVFISSRESLAHTGAKLDDQNRVLFSRYSEFLAIAFLKPDLTGKLEAQWVLRNPTQTAVSWPKDYEQGFLSKMNFKSAMTNGRAYWNVKGPDGSPLAAVGFSIQVVDLKKKVESPPPRTAALSGAPVRTAAAVPSGTDEFVTAWIVGILPAAAFNDLVNDYSTGINTGFIVDDQGVAVAHSDPASRWKNLEKQSVVAEVLKKDRPSGAGNFIDLDGRAIIGSFEHAPKFNLTAVVTTPSDKAFEAAEVMAKNIFFIGVMILIIALATAILLSNYLTAPLQKLAMIAAQIGAGDFHVTVDVKTNDEIGDLANSFTTMEKSLLDRDEALAAAQGALVQSEKMSAFGQLSAGIAHEVKNPLAGILGHAQLAMGKAQTDDMKKHLEVIEKETRRCKTIVENLMRFARAEKAELQLTDLAQVVQDTVNLVDHQLTLAGCKIFKDIKRCPLVMANGNQLQQVLLNLMVNSSHATENCPTKNVTIRLVQVGQNAQIQIEDTGKGIPPEIQKKIFEPFFTTKPAGKGTGLGLSVSIGIVKDHKGEIYLKSEINKGTTFFIDIPIPENAKIFEGPLENQYGGQQAVAPELVAKPVPVAAQVAVDPVKPSIAPRQTPLVSPLLTTTSTRPLGTALPRDVARSNDTNARPLSPDQPRPKLTVAATTPLDQKSAPAFPKIEMTIDPSEKKKEEVFFGPSTNSSIADQALASGQAPGQALAHADKILAAPETLGGLAPSKEEAAFPEPPQETNPITSLFNTSAVNKTEPAAETVSSDFKVKITRPKLKA